MSRSVTGVYSLPAGNPVSAGELIESAWANSTMTDIANALTDSLSRTGLGGMLAPFQNTAGTIGAPGITWSVEPTSGWYRKAFNEFYYAIGGVDIFGITADGIVLASGEATGIVIPPVTVQEDDPSPVDTGSLWFESDAGDLYMRYQNPDDTFTWILVNGPTAEAVTSNIPIGGLLDYAGNSTPTGWLYCDGAAISRVTFADLFAAIGTTWGSGDGSTTFNVPDFRGRTSIGNGVAYAAAGLGGAIGNVGGEALHTPTLAEMFAHSHTGGTGSQNASHTHGGSTSGMVGSNPHSHQMGDGSFTQNIFDSVGAGTGMASSGGGTQQNAASVFTSQSNIDHSHTFTTGAEAQPHQHAITAEGSSTPFNVIGPSGTVMKIIRYA